jgi:hypothetical protein
MYSLSQRNQAGKARDYQREQAHRYHHSEDDDYFPRARILRWDGGFHGLLSLLCTWGGGLQSKRGKAAGKTAKTLEEKLDRREEVLDYFDLRKAGNEKYIRRNFFGWS